jgi:hypothetical protein
MIVKVGEHEDDIEVFGVYKNKTDAEKDMHRMDKKTFDLQYDDIEIRETEFHNSCSKFYTVLTPAIKNEYGAYVTGMTEEPIIPERNYETNTITFSLDCESDLAIHLNRDMHQPVKEYGYEIAKSIDEKILHEILDLIECELNVRFTSNTTLSLVDTWISDEDKYLKVIDGHPELKVALNSALSCTSSGFNEYLSLFKTRTLGYPITDRLISQIKEDLYAELDKDEFYSRFNFRDNPSLIPVVRATIIKKLKG